jgi:hypothetical protein
MRDVLSGTPASPRTPSLYPSTFSEMISFMDEKYSSYHCPELTILFPAQYLGSPTKDMTACDKAW